MSGRGKSLFAKRLTSALEYSKVSQAKLAERLGITRAAVSAWCNGTAEPTIGRFEEIAKHLKVRKSYLLGEEEPASFPSEFERLHHQIMTKAGRDRRESQKRLEELSDYIAFLRSRTHRKAP